MIRRHVEALGFKFSDIRILLASHALLFTVIDDKGSYRVLIANIPSILAETKLPPCPPIQM
jgi:hypothetical protein